MPTLQQRALEIKSKMRVFNDCWEYPTQRRAYLTVNGAQTLVYRIMYEALKGPVPEGSYLLHTCDNKWCCNPEHLQPGTQRLNVIQAVERGLVDSKSPLAGVSWQGTRNRWLVMPRIEGKKVCIYAGKSLFEAACARKSWELKNANPLHP